MPASEHYVIIKYIKLLRNLHNTILQVEKTTSWKFTHHMAKYQYFSPISRFCTSYFNNGLVFTVLCSCYLTNLGSKHIWAGRDSVCTWFTHYNLMKNQAQDDTLTRASLMKNV